MMTVSKLIDEIAKNAELYANKFDVKIDKEFAAYSLVKEIGQFAEARLINTGKSIPSKRLNEQDAKERMTQELVDIIAMAIINADLYDIDIEKALKEKWVEKTGS